MLQITFFYLLALTTGSFAAAVGKQSSVLLNFKSYKVVLNFSLLYAILYFNSGQLSDGDSDAGLATIKCKEDCAERIPCPLDCGFCIWPQSTKCCPGGNEIIIWKWGEI
jgi:hypothetical protein